MGFPTECGFFIESEVCRNWPNVESDPINDAYEILVLKYNQKNDMLITKV